MKQAIIAPLALVLACQCCKPGGQAPARTPPPEQAAEVGKEEAGKGGTVTITGEAADAKLSAVVLKDGVPYYLIEIDGWPEDVVGRTVEATGVLEETETFEAKVDETGAVSQGAGEPILVLRNASYEVK